MSRKRASARAKLVTGMARRIDGRPRSAMPSSASWGVVWSNATRAGCGPRRSTSHAPFPVHVRSAAWRQGVGRAPPIQVPCWAPLTVPRRERAHAALAFR
jgi:hypothetical protein